MEVSFEYLIIRKLYLPTTLFRIVNKHTLIVFPIIFQQLKVGIVETSSQRHRVIVIDFPQPIEFVLQPITFIGKLTTFIIELPIPIHFVILPRTLIVSSILVVKLTTSVSHVITLESFVTTSRLILLHHVLLFMRF